MLCVHANTDQQHGVVCKRSKVHSKSSQSSMAFALHLTEMESAMISTSFFTKYGTCKPTREKTEPRCPSVNDLSNASQLDLDELKRGRAK